jgi:hypothetical protein
MNNCIGVLYQFKDFLVLLDISLCETDIVDILDCCVGRFLRIIYCRQLIQSLVRDLTPKACRKPVDRCSIFNLKALNIVVFNLQSMIAF